MAGLSVESIHWKGEDRTDEWQASLELAAGETLWLQGPSGVGKSTLLRLLAGEDLGGEFSAGSWKLGGRDFLSMQPRERAVGWVPQELAMFPGLSAWQNAAFGLKVRGLSWRESRARVESWFEDFDLKDRMEIGADHLSGGEQARVALIRALAFGPKLLLLDEPFAGLDEEMRARVAARVTREVRERAVPTILVHHGTESPIPESRIARLEKNQSAVVLTF